VRVFMIGNKPVDIIHKKPKEGGISAVGGTGSVYTSYAVDCAEYAELLGKFLNNDLPRIMPALGLKDEPLPLVWTGDFIPVDGADGETNYIIGEFNCSCVGIANFKEAYCTEEKPEQGMHTVSVENMEEGMKIMNLLGEQAVSILDGDRRCEIATNDTKTSDEARRELWMQKCFEDLSLSEIQQDQVRFEVGRYYESLGVIGSELMTRIEEARLCCADDDTSAECNSLMSDLVRSMGELCSQAGEKEKSMLLAIEDVLDVTQNFELLGMTSRQEISVASDACTIEAASSVVQEAIQRWSGGNPDLLELSEEQVEQLVYQYRNVQVVEVEGTQSLHRVAHLISQGVISGMEESALDSLLGKLAEQVAAFNTNVEQGWAEVRGSCNVVQQAKILLSLAGECGESEVLRVCSRWGMEGDTAMLSEGAPSLWEIDTAVGTGGKMYRWWLQKCATNLHLSMAKQLAVESSIGECRQQAQGFQKQAFKALCELQRTFPCSSAFS